MEIPINAKRRYKVLHRESQRLLEQGKADAELSNELALLIREYPDLVEKVHTNLSGTTAAMLRLGEEWSKDGNERTETIPEVPATTSVTETQGKVSSFDSDRLLSVFSTAAECLVWACNIRPNEPIFALIVFCVATASPLLRRTFAEDGWLTMIVDPVLFPLVAYFAFRLMRRDVLRSLVQCVVTFFTLSRVHDAAIRFASSVL